MSYGSTNDPIDFGSNAQNLAELNAGKEGNELPGKEIAQAIGIGSDAIIKRPPRQPQTKGRTRRLKG